MLTVLQFINSDEHHSRRKSVLEEAIFFSKSGIRMILLYIPGDRPGLTEALIKPFIESGISTYALYPLDSENRSVLSQALVLREFCRKHSVDVVHTHGSMECAVACRAGFLGLKTVHINTVYTVQSKNLQTFLSEKLLSCYCDEWIAVDWQVEQYLLENMMPESKVSVVRNGFDFKKPLAPGLRGKQREDDAFTLVFAADSDCRWDPERCKTVYELFLSVIIRLERKLNGSGRIGDYRKLRYLIADPGDFPDDVPEEMGIKAFADKVMIIPCKPDEINALATKADLFFCCSDNDSFPYPVLNAMAHGIPTLTDDNRFYSEIKDMGAEAGCRYIEFQSVKTISKWIVELISEKRRYKAAVKNARQVIEQSYNFDDTVYGLYNAYVKGLKTGSAVKMPLKK